MNWGSWDAFWAMGGHAWYVWGSYGLMAILLVLEVWLLRQRLRAAREQARRVNEEGTEP
jgi:heme exporter protein D